MGKLIFAAIMVLVGIVGFKVLKRISFEARAQKSGALATAFKLASTIVLITGIGIPSLVFLFSIFRVIPAGHVGVKVLFGEVDSIPLKEGLNVVWNPLYEVVMMDTRVTKHEADYSAASKDLQVVHVKMALYYRLMPDSAPEMYKSVGLEYASIILDPAAQEVLKANTANHNAVEILQKRPLIKADVQRDLAAWLAKYKIELKEASLADIKFDETYAKAIEAKQIEEQKAEQKRYELIQAQRQAEIAAATAKGLGDAAREEAKGQADATRLRGEAETNYNTKVAASLTPALIKQQYLMKWDGKLPVYMLGGDKQGGTFLMLPSDNKK